jgi:nucleoside-diphosphate-sugar epimerase
MNGSAVDTWSDKKIVITGGAGFLGINLIRYLVRRGFSNITSLDLAEFSYPEKAVVHTVVGDIRDPGVVRSALQGASWVVHAAAALPLYSPEDIYSTEVNGTQVLLDAARDEGVERFVYISSTAVYGVPKHCPVTEEDDLSGVGSYGRAKIHAERLCEYFREDGMCIPVIRPKSFVGPERLGAFELLFNFAADGRAFPVIGPGNNRYQLLDVEDLCEAILLCLTLDPAAANDTFNVGAERFETIRRDFQAVLDAAGYGRHVVSFPRWASMICLRVLELLGLSPLYGWIYQTAAKDSYVSTERAAERLGFAPRFSNRQALLRNFSWYLAHRAEITARAGVSHRTPWRHGLLSLLKGLL